MSDNDLIAVGAMKALLELGYRIPEDVSVIGIDDMPCGTIITPKLTTVRIYKKKIGSLAVDRLLTLCEEPDDISQKVLINTMLLERDSVACLKNK
jgi:LacI family transcriptional regulator